MTLPSSPHSRLRGIVAIPLPDKDISAEAAETKLIYAPGIVLFCTLNVPPPNAILLHLTFRGLEILDQAVHLIHGVPLIIFQQDGAADHACWRTA